jgi:hypothetical protein
VLVLLRGRLVAHRIVGLSEAHVQTKGDSCATPDQWTPIENIAGRVLAVGREGEVRCVSFTLRLGLLPFLRYAQARIWSLSKACLRPLWRPIRAARLRHAATRPSRVRTPPGRIS